MKKRKLQRKLVLNKEKIAVLNSNVMMLIQGGGSGDPRTTPSNNTKGCDTTSYTTTTDTITISASEFNCDGG
jgi:hypothetical protein